VLCLHFPYLATDRVQRRENSQSPGAMVLVEPAGASLRVARVCPRAAELGLRIGLTLGEAQAMAPGVRSRAHDPHADRVCLRALADWAIRFSPVVQAIEPETLWLDVTGCRRLFGGEPALIRRAVSGLVRGGFHVRAALADTPGAAHALAVAGAEPMCIAPPGQASAWLAPLPPAALRIDERSVRRLDSVGVRTIGDLLMLPRSSLPARFGTQLVTRLEQALGRVYESLTPHEPGPPPSARLLFESPVTDWSALGEAAGSLLREVFEPLLRSGRVARRVDCVLYAERAAPRVLTIALSRPSRNPAHVAQLLSQRLERIDLNGGVSGMMLAARHTTRWTPAQGELFEPRPAGDQERFAQLVDRLVNHLGHQAVRRPLLIDDYQPERACRYVSVAEAGLEAIDVGRPPRAGVPTRLYPRPLLIRVVTTGPNDPPTAFYDRGREHVVTTAAGPQRIETGWWRGTDVQRDYYRITTAGGEQFWIFRCRMSGEWRLHGAFA
jgi:protein ImuB